MESMSFFNVSNYYQWLRPDSPILHGLEGIVILDHLPL
ncbi:uncharacterized protein METZ01_LOCUS428654 [marine metagenome]|uniref:Uncharacterized protein n=1 Tax=marine metagenome TaxID=408172 RepID=A0A382XY47_9ZZZZ